MKKKKHELNAIKLCEDDLLSINGGLNISDFGGVVSDFWLGVLSGAGYEHGRYKPDFTSPYGAGGTPNDSGAFSL